MIVDQFSESGNSGVELKRIIIFKIKPVSTLGAIIRIYVVHENLAERDQFSMIILFQNYIEQRYFVP